ncbi:FGGY-family carbohydrate kinase [Kribbella capetownensis]|uniref:FGGY-family carbohydrate kinase n=1 Tax=Kribbella capetownensis TaxID=1572659 RepID=UPI0013F46EAC|nr:FGGY family carbohydrate kinase [Kribbella capetownensis]
MTWLGVDVGTTNLKVCRVPGGTTRSVPTPDDALALQGAVRRLVGELSDGERVDGIGIAGMAETGAPLDRGLQPLTKLITWRDQPGVAQAERLRAEVGECGVFARTGLRLSPKLPVVTWRWLRETQPATVARTRIWAGAPDLALAALTGTYATHLTHAQRLGTLDLHTRAWDPELLTFGGLDRLPPVTEPMTVTATTAAGVPVVLCGHDHLVGAWAAGVREPGQVADSLGTSEAVITPSHSPVMDDVLRQQGISTGWYVDGRHGCAISGHGAAGGLVEQRLAALGRDYGWLSEALNAVRAPSELHVAPYPQGRQAPLPDSTPTYDVTRPVDDHGEEMRALVDGLSFHARWMAEEQTRLLGIEWRSTVAFGGPTRLAGWMERKAYASGGRDFAVLRGAATAAEGAALMAAEVVTGRPVEPLQARPIAVRPQVAETWDSHFWHRFHRVVSRTA